jgi:hypothetical protein
MAPLRRALGTLGAAAAAAASRSTSTAVSSLSLSIIHPSPAPVLLRGGTAAVSLLLHRRGIQTKSPLEDELEYQRSLDEREAQQWEMRETAAAIANAKTIATAPGASSSEKPPKPKPKPPVFGAPMGTGVGGARGGGGLQLSNPVIDPQLETTWLQPLSPPLDPS